MKPFSIAAPEDIAKEYGGDKRKIQRAAAQGMIDPTSAVLAGMFIDRMRNAAAAEQAPQATVAEQVMSPQPQMPSAGLTAAPQAGQMQQPMPPRMGQPSAPQMPQPAQPRMAQAPQMPPQQPQGMAMGGGLDSIDFVEQGYAPGGLVSFQAGGPTQDQLMAQSRSLIEALSASRDPAERRAIEARLRQITSGISVAPPGLVTEPLGPQPGDDRAGLANLDMLREMEADTRARARYAEANPVDFGADMEMFTEGTPIQRGEGLMGALNQGSDMFAELKAASEDPTVSRVEQERRDRVARVQDAMDAPSPFDFSGRGGDPAALGEADRALYADRARSRVDPTGQVPTLSSLAGGFSGRGGDPFALGEAERPTAQPDFGTGRSQIDPTPFFAQPEAIADTGISPDAPSEQPTVADQIEAAAPKPVEAAEQETTTPSTGKSVEDYFSELSELRGEEVGPYTKELQGMLANRADTMSTAKKDAFNMALLQTGLGMLSQKGQPGGALQAAGKAALPAVKEATSAIKQAKKEDRELLKLGASIEQAEGKRKDSLLNSAIKQHGADKTAAATIRAAEINANRSTDFDRKIDGLVGGYKAADKALGADMQPDSVYEARAIQYVEEQAVRRAQVAAGASTARTVTSETEDWRGRREDFIAGLEGTDGLTAKAQWANAFKNSEGRTPTSAEWEQEKQRRIDAWNRRNPEPGAPPPPAEGEKSAITSGAGTQASPFVLTQRVPESQMVTGKYYTFPNGVTAVYQGNGKFRPIK